MSDTSNDQPGWTDEEVPDSMIDADASPGNSSGENAHEEEAEATPGGAEPEDRPASGSSAHEDGNRS